MGPYQRSPKEVTRVIRYSGLGVRSLGPVGDFLDMIFCCCHAQLLFFLSIKISSQGGNHFHPPHFPGRKNYRIYKGGPLPVITGFITPITRVIRTVSHFL